MIFHWYLGFLKNSFKGHYQAINREFEYNLIIKYYSYIQYSSYDKSIIIVVR